MNRLIKIILMIIVPIFSNGQTITDSISMEFAGSKYLRIANINGSINVVGTDNSAIEMNARRYIKADDRDDFDYASKNIKLGHKVVGDTLVVYIEGLPDCDCNYAGKPGESYSYYWDQGIDCDFKFDMLLKVPRQIYLIASTVNDGNIKIADMSGKMRIRNINGDISVSEIKNKIYLKTINGDVDLDFESSPFDNSKFYTLNGNITAYFPTPLNADIAFKTFNGDFYTSVENVKQHLISEKEESSDKSSGVKYKVGARSNIRLNEGGVKMDFETFNGDVIIKEK